MKEKILRDFFEGTCTAQDLARDMHRSMATAENTTHHHIEPMENEFAVNCGHLVAICDAVLKGHIEPGDLELIGNCIVGSDAFTYDVDTVDGARVADTTIDWATPLANYPLTMANVSRWRRRLLGEVVEPRPNGV